jgi:hypothetical protein
MSLSIVGTQRYGIVTVQAPCRMADRARRSHLQHDRPDWAGCGRNSPASFPRSGLDDAYQSAHTVVAIVRLAESAGISHRDDRKGCAVIADKVTKPRICRSVHRHALIKRARSSRYEGKCKGSTRQRSSLCTRLPACIGRWPGFQRDALVPDGTLPRPWAESARARQSDLLRHGGSTRRQPFWSRSPGLRRRCQSLSTSLSGRAQARV